MAAPDAAGFAAGDRALQAPGRNAGTAVHCLDGVRGRLTERSSAAELKAGPHYGSAGRPIRTATARASGYGHVPAGTAHAADRSRASVASAPATATFATDTGPSDAFAHATTARAAAPRGHR
jgi:hypothetical protein